MKIIKKREYSSDIGIVEIGDQIGFDLNGAVNGYFTATAQKIDNDGILFLFDDCIAEHRMNEKDTNEGGFEASELNRWLQEDVILSFPEELRKLVSDISIPSYGMMFGHDEWYETRISPDNDEQLSLMKIRKNRIADFNGAYSWYWLKNHSVSSAMSFAFVRVGGGATGNYASDALGVRPAVTLQTRNLANECEPIYAGQLKMLGINLDDGSLEKALSDSLKTAMHESFSDVWKRYFHIS